MKKNIKINITEYLVEFLFCLLGFALCLFLIHKDIHPVLASSFTGFIGSFLPTSERYNVRNAKACIYAASFCAIGAHLICHGPLQYLILPAILSLLFSFSKNFFVGFGGKLGTIAFTATGVFLLLKEIF